MALGKTPVLVIDNQTIGTSASVESSGIDLSGVVDFGLGFTLTFNAAATLGARIDLYADPAGASASFTVGDYDDPIDSQAIALDAGHTVSGFFQMHRTAKYVKAKLVNLDTAQTITAASAWSQIQTA
jgi:hypothetical protein